jgi:hypothetical protein
VVCKIWLFQRVRVRPHLFSRPVYSIVPENITIISSPSSLLMHPCGRVRVASSPPSASPSGAVGWDVVSFCLLGSCPTWESPHLESLGMHSSPQISDGERFKLKPRDHLQGVYACVVWQFGRLALVVVLRSREAASAPSAGNHLPLQIQSTGATASFPPGTSVSLW